MPRRWPGSTGRENGRSAGSPCTGRPGWGRATCSPPPLLTEAEALRPAAGAALDDADLAPEPALLHLINRHAEAGAPLLLAARRPPARWGAALPDLASRLRATAAAGISPPGDALLAALLAKLLADRQLRMAPDLQAWLLRRLPREAAALAEAVARLDRAALAAGGAVTRALARATLPDMDGAPEPPLADEASVSAPGGTSPAPNRLL
jgi:chromosomal replication initiation ATPase DnaA